MFAYRKEFAQNCLVSPTTLLYYYSWLFTLENHPS